VLSYFDTVLGPIITHAMRLDNSGAPIKLPLDLQKNIQKLIDSQTDEGFFVHSIKIHMTANVYFRIPSEWARGKYEMLCLSILIRSKNPELFKATLEAGVGRLKAIPDLYKAFYREKKINDEAVEKKRQELEESLALLCQDVLQAKKQAITKNDRRERTREQTRDQARDHDRDQTRDHDRDQNRDSTRDHERDQSRDHDRDQVRDLDRDKTRDLDREHERDE